MKDVLDRAFSASERKREFVDRCLGASDTQVSHSWAVKRLVDRYSEPDERLLTPESQAKLGEMFRTHLRQLRAENAELDSLIGLLPASATQHADLPERWRARMLALFALVQKQDSLVTNLIVGAQTNGEDAAGASRSLRSAHETIGALLDGLNDLEIGHERK